MSVLPAPCMSILPLKSRHFCAFTALLFSLLLGGCVTVPVDVENMDQSFGARDQKLQDSSTPKTGYYLTRVLADSFEPNALYNSTDLSGSLIVLDMGLELKHTENGNYYRLHVFPLRLTDEQKANWHPWVEIRLRGGNKKSPILYAKLPDTEADDTSSNIVTDWFMCDSCLRGQESRFADLATADSKTTLGFWYDIVATPKYTPEWRGDMEAREAKFQAIADEKQRQLDALEASLPPQVRRDKYMVQLSANLKQQNYQQALEIFPKLESLPVATDPSLKFFYGEALLKTGQPTQALQKFYEYINEQGNSATHYAKTLELINQAESQL